MQSIGLALLMMMRHFPLIWSSSHRFILGHATGGTDDTVDLVQNRRRSTVKRGVVVHNGLIVTSEDPYDVPLVIFRIRVVVDMVAAQSDVGVTGTLVVETFGILMTLAPDALLRYASLVDAVGADLESKLLRWNFLGLVPLMHNLVL